MLSESIIIIKAQWIIPIVGKPIEHGTILIKNGRILDLEEKENYSKRKNKRFVLLNLPSSIILPGLINAHIHINLAGFPFNLNNTETYEEWLKNFYGRLMKIPHNHIKLMKCELTKLITRGTAFVGCVVNSKDECRALEQSNLEGVIFWELIDDPLISSSYYLNKIHKIFTKPKRNGFIYTLSLNSLYTNCESTIKSFINIINNKEKFTAIHLAESPEEVEFIKYGTGPLRKIFASHNPLNNWHPKGMSPIQYADSLGLFNTSLLIIHANCVDENDVGLMQRKKLPICVCPRSNLAIRAPQPPIRRFLDKGLIVALGTDGYATNSDLYLFKEMEFTYKAHPEVQYQEILEMATLGGAKALHLEDDYGSLEIGKKALFTIASLPKHSSIIDPYETLIKSHENLKMEVLKL